MTGEAAAAGATLWQALAAVLVVLGALLIAAAAVGLLRLPDLLMRMHANTKAGTLGVGLVMIGVAILVGEVGPAVRALTTSVLVFLTAPVSAHLLGRAAYRARVPLWSGTVVDERAQEDTPDADLAPPDETDPAR